LKKKHFKIVCPAVGDSDASAILEPHVIVLILQFATAGCCWLLAAFAAYEKVNHFV